MKRVAFKQISDKEGIAEFLKRFETNIGVLLPQKYAEQGETVGMYLNDNLVGGFMLVTKPDFRSLKFIPEDAKTSLPIFEDLSSGKYLEINGLWVDKTIRKTPLSMNIWLEVRRQILRNKASKLILMYNAQAKGLEKFYTNVLHPSIFYNGPTAVPAGQDQSHATISVGLVSKWSVFWAPLRGTKIFVSRRVYEAKSFASNLARSFLKKNIFVSLG